MSILGTRGRVCLIVAHPDDEAMFFTPMIKRVCGEGSQMYVLCLTNGNYYGLGKVREKELYDACGELGITKERVRVVSNDRLQDQPNERWSHKDVIHEVESFVDEHSIDFIVTFDEYGVSGHINHISTYESLREWIRGSQRESYPKVYVLETSNIFIKYSGLFSMVYYYFFPTSGR